MSDPEKKENAKNGEAKKQEPQDQIVEDRKSVV